MEEIKVCPICGSVEFNKKISCKDYTVSHETFQLVACNVCELLITNPRPDEKSINRYYVSDQYISHTRTAKTWIDRLYLLARKVTLRKKLRLINNLQPEKGTLLDYGCGTGEFLYTCKQAGWKVAGVEPSDVARKKADESLQSDVQNYLSKEVTIRYDVITLWHVLEHVPDLTETLEKISEHLNNTGTLIIAVPNHKSYDAQHYGTFWAGFDVPRHLWHLSRGSMQKLLKKNSLRLENIIPMKLDSFYVSLLSEKYKGNSLGLTGMIKAFYNGIRSNFIGGKNGEYSSLIYIIKK